MWTHINPQLHFYHSQLVTRRIMANYVVLAFPIVNSTWIILDCHVDGWFILQKNVWCVALYNKGAKYEVEGFSMSCRWLRSKRIRPFHFYYVMLCADCRRLPTRVAIWSWETKSHSHGPTGFPITWIAALSLVFEQFFFFFFF